MSIFRSKLLVVHSPLPQSGKTTMANLIGLELASKDSLVLVIEINPLTGYSTFLHKRVHEMKRNLKKVLVTPSLLNENIQKSPHNPNLFFICQNLHDSIVDMETYNPENLDKIITLAKKNFDYIIIDLQSRVLDLSTIRVLGANFGHEIDHYITVIDENILSYKVFNDMNDLLSKQATGRRKTTLVVNKSHDMYSDFIKPFLKTLPQSDILNVVNVPEVPLFRFVANEGNPYNLGKTKESKAFFDSITTLGDIIAENKAGVGIDLNSRQSKENIKTEKRRGGKIQNTVEDKKKAKELAKEEKQRLREEKRNKSEPDKKSVLKDGDETEAKPKAKFGFGRKSNQDGSNGADTAKSRLKSDRQRRAQTEISDDDLDMVQEESSVPKKKLGFRGRSK